MDKARELLEEFRQVFSGRGARWLDSLVPLLVFLVANPLLGLASALWAASIAAALFGLYRVIKGENLVYALAGLGGVLLAGLFVKLSGSESGFFLPGLFSGAVTTAACIVSVLFNRPLAAWSSFITRRWPLGWYWHPRVVPAYSEVTIFWGLAFAGRLSVQYGFYQAGNVNALGAAGVLLGWPFIVVLLIFSYLYGLWRLDRLGGPSIEEFKTGQPPPWKGQKRGF